MNNVTRGRSAFVRQPAPDLSKGELTHIERVPVDADLALTQWHDYRAAFAEHGWTTHELEPQPAMADAVFVEDAIVLFGDLAVVTRPGAASRTNEIVSAEAGARALLDGFEFARIEAPGTLEGGDVLKVGTTVYVGATTRTNGEGIRQLRAILAPRGYNVVAVPVTRALHLKSAVTALPDGTIIGHNGLVDQPTVFERYLPVPDVHGVAVVDLGEGRLLISQAAPVTIGLLDTLGYTCVPVNVSEFEKLEGCVTCLSVRIR